MRWFDTHAHLDFADFDTDREQLLLQLANEEIGVINPATDEASVAKIDELTAQSELVWGAVGLHPTDVTPEIALRLPEILQDWDRRLQTNPRLIALGEVGLDYYHKKESATLQKTVLRQMLTFAVERDLPVIFHCRDAYGDLTTLLESYPKIRGVVHCFSGTAEQAEQFLAAGLALSFTCVVTYEKNEALREVVATTPLNRLIIETDSPFLSPNDRRGQRNDPRSVVRVAEVVATAHHQSLEEIAKQTTANALKLFRIKL